MYLEHKYIGKIENGPLKVELYDTGKRTWTFKKVYAYQLFDNNRKVHEDESFVPCKDDLQLFDQIVEEATFALPAPAALGIEYFEVFEVEA